MTTSATPKLPLQNVCTSQPQGSIEIDWSNPITRGLVVAVNGTSLVDAVSGARPTVSVNATHFVTSKGLARKYVYNATSDTAYGDTYLAPSFGGGIPVTCFCLVLQSDASAIYGIFGSSGSSTGFAVKPNGGVNRFVVWDGSQKNALGTAPKFGVPEFIVGTADGTTARIYQDGVLTGSGAAGFPTATGGGTLTIGSCFGSNSNAAVILSGAFTRVLSLTEIKSLSANPWQVFTARTPQYLTPTSAVQSIQPTNPLRDIDWDNPITTGLKFVSNAASDVESVSKQGKIVSTAMVNSPDSVSYPVGNGQDTAFVSKCGDFSDELTLVSVGKTGTLQNNTGTVVFVGCGSSTAGLLPSRLGQDSYAGGNTPMNSIYYYPAYSGTSLTTATGAMAANQPYVLIGVYKRNSENTVYVNGIQAATTVPDDFAANLNVTAASVFVGSGDIRSLGVTLAMVFTRKLSAAEITSLSNNPWQVFKALPSVTSHEVVTPRKSYMLGGRPPASSTAAIVGMGASNNTRFSPPNPQDAKINVANPITKNIISAYLPFGKLVLDIACNSKVTTNGGFTMAESATSTPTAYGLGISFGGGSYRRESKFVESGIGYEPDLTVLSLFVPLSTAVSGNLCAVGGSGGEVPCTLQLVSGGFIKGTQGQDNANAITHQNSVVFNTANVAVYRNKHKIGNALQKLTLNGVPGSTTATSSVQSGYSAWGLNIGDSTNPANSVKFLLNIVWNRILSDDEVASVSKNPWQIFAPDNQPVFGRAI